MRQERFSILLVVILFLFAIEPLCEDSLVGYVLDLSLLLIILSCINAVSAKRWHFYATVLLSAAGAAALAAARLAASTSLARPAFTVHCIALIVCLGFTIVIILTFVLEAGKVTRNKIAAAICVYFLMGLLFALAYFVVAALVPGAFAFGGAPIFPQADVERLLAGRFSLVYYSFTTLTTLGYGDITPVAPAARSFAALEAIFGQLYLAVMIARLVGLHIVHTTAGGEGRHSPDGTP